MHLYLLEQTINELRVAFNRANDTGYHDLTINMADDGPYTHGLDPISINFDEDGKLIVWFPEISDPQQREFFQEMLETTQAYKQFQGLYDTPEIY